MFVLYAVLDGDREYLGCAEYPAQLRLMLEEGIKDGTMMFYDTLMRPHEQVRFLRKTFPTLDTPEKLNQYLKFAEVQMMDEGNQEDVVSTMAGTLCNSGPLSDQCADAIYEILTALKKSQKQK